MGHPYPPTTRRHGRDPRIDAAGIAAAHAARLGKPPEEVERLRAERKTLVLVADLEHALAEPPALSPEQRRRLADMLLADGGGEDA